MPRKKKNVIAVTPGGDITLDHIMGFYTLYTVPDKPVSTSKLNRLWVAEGLPHDLIPHERDAKHNFMAAVRKIESRRKTDDKGARKEIEVDQVKEDANRVVYQVTSLVRDDANEVINHPKAMRVVYDKHEETIEGEPLDKGALTDDELKGLVERVQNQFDENATKTPGARVRAAVRSLMKEVGATNVRRKSRQGVYFVPKDGKETLDSLERVIEGLWKDDGELHLIFAANADGEKELVERHFTVSVSEDIDALMAEATEALKGEGRKLRKDRVGNMLRERNELGNQRSKYAALLDASLDETEVKLGLLDAQLEKLVINMGDE